MYNITKQLILIALLCANFTFTANATVRYVKTLGNINSNGLGGWTNASSNLQAMISASSPGDEVWVAATQGNDPANAYTTSQYPNYFVMKEGVKIYGGFPVNGGTWESRNWQTNKTYLTHGNHTPCPTCAIELFGAANRSVIFNHDNGLTDAAVLDGFYIIDGFSTRGGGIYNYNASPLIANCKIESCKAIYLHGNPIGGAVYNGNSSAKFISVTFVNNTANGSYGLVSPGGTGPFHPGYGGAVYNSGGAPSFSRCTFSNNTTLGGNGGAVYSNNSNAQFYNCNFSGNQVTASAQAPNSGYGGGIYNNGNSVLLSICTVTGNSAVFGGGIYHSGGELTAFSGQINNNRATKDGGGIYLNGGTYLPSSMSTRYNKAENGGGIYLNGGSMNSHTGQIERDTATKNGGGLYNNGANVQTTGMLFFQYNHAENGGGIFNKGAVNYHCVYEGNTRFQIMFNYASQHGGGIYNDTTTSVWNRYVWISDNTASNCGGGLYNKAGNNIFNKIIVTGNRAVNGGGVYNDNTIAIFNDYFNNNYFPYGISDNEATQNGGGLYNHSSTVTIDNQVLFNDTAQYGGAIYHFNGNLVLKNTELKNNLAINHGGALYVQSPNKVIDTNNIFKSNRAQLGGAIFAVNTAYRQTASTLSDNFAPRGGACFLLGGSHSLFQKSEFRNNGDPNMTVGSKGGAIYADGSKEGDAQFTNLLIANNYAEFGAGIYCDIMTLDIIHNTITENRGREGSGLFYVDRVHSLIRCDNSIIWGNFGATGKRIPDNVSNTTHTGDNITFKSCDIEGSNAWDPGYLGINNGSNMDKDPLFYPSPDYHLTKNSPCIGFCPILLLDDKDGNPRPVGPNSDIGCYENQDVFKNAMLAHTDEESNISSEATATLQLYPNPVASGQALTLEMGGYEDAAVEVTVYNILGMKVLQTNATNGINSIALPAAAGTYLVKVTAATGEVICRDKVTVQ